jgi:AAA15 family ATPase/GTPase
MLLRFSVSNFTSIRDFQELSLVASSLSDKDGALIISEGLAHKLLRVAAIYGPNASGKTNILSGLRFMRNAVKNSQSKWEPGAAIDRNPFALDESAERPSEFAVDFLLDGVRYEYGFAIDNTRVLHEYLFAYPENRRQRWFERSSGHDQITFGKYLTGENRAIENLTRPESLFLSAAAQNNHEKLLPIYNWFTNQLVFISGLNTHASQKSTIDLCMKNEEAKRTVLRLLAGADLGIVDMDIKDEEPDPKTNAFVEKFQALLTEFATDPNRTPPKFGGHYQTVFFQHKSRGNKSVPISMSDESAGTLTYLAMLGPAIEVLASGGILCVDELDASLHPLLVADIVKIFNRAENNPHGAQLIFTTHNTELLSSDLLRRDEIWFTEKDEEGATRLYPLSDFKPRREENLQRGYLQGRYGATPFIRASALLGKL